MPAGDRARPCHRRRRAARSSGCSREQRWSWGLVAVVLVVTLGAREGIGEQTAVGTVDVAAIAAVATSPTDADTLVAAHPAGLQVSRDGGATWQPADFPRATRSVAATRTGFVAITDDGPFRSDGTAANWTPGDVVA